MSATLGAAERVALITAANKAWHDGAVTVDRMVGALENVIERILADRLAAADRDAGLRERVEALAEKWDGVLAEVLADHPSALVTQRDVAALDTCLRELRAALDASQ